MCHASSYHLDRGIPLHVWWIMGKAKQPEIFAKLSAEALKAAQAEKVKRDNFVRHFKGSGAKGDPYRGFTDLTLGYGVPWPVADGFVAYLCELGLILKAEGALVECPPRETDRIWDTFGKIMKELYDHTENAGGVDVTIAGSRLVEAAEAIVAHAGRMNTASAAGRTEVQRGEAVMGCSVEHYTHWLQSVYQANHRAVQLAADTKGRPVSVCVLFAVTPETFEAVCAGRLADTDISPDSMLDHGGHLFVAAVSPLGDQSGIAAIDRERAEVHCVFRQAAFFTRRLRPFRPALCTFASNRLVRERLDLHGYMPTGATLKGTEKAVMVLRKPDGGRGRAYYMMCRAIDVYRFAFREQWRREDRRRRI